LFSSQFSLLGFKSGHDGIKLSNGFLRSLDDSIDNSFSLWGISTEFRNENLFLSS
jgi:hypothetical protein